MACLYDILCHHSFSSTDPLLEDLLSYLPTSFPSHIFDYLVHGHSSDDESVHSIDSLVSAFHSDDSSYCSQKIPYLSTISATPKFYHKDNHTTVKKAVES